jgi:RNA polymerase sigma factor (sigma-70 family)
VEASALHQASLPALAGRSPLLRLQGDEKLIALVRRGHNGAFEALVQRYQPRLLAFCRHMLSSQEDAEDVLQEVFAAAYNALLADERPINARPWLYRIARNRCLNHLRKPRAAGQDSMDIFERDNGTTTAETVHGREEFRQIVTDVGELPETQRTALLLREIDALSYDQIAEAMDTTIPSVKSLLVRARVSLAEAAEARLLTCEEARFELGRVAEGLGRTTAPVRRHLKVCDRCRMFRTELKSTSKALAAIYPVGPLVMLKLAVAKLGLGGGAAAGSAASSGAGFAGAAGGAATAAGAGGAASGMVGAGLGTIAAKAAAGMAAAMIVTAGAVEVKQVAKDKPAGPGLASVAPRAPIRTTVPAVRAEIKDPVRAPVKTATKHAKSRDRAAKVLKVPAPKAPTTPVKAPAAPVAPATTPTVQEEESTTVLPPRTDPLPTPEETHPTPPPGETVGTPPQQPAPPPVVQTPVPAPVPVPVPVPAPPLVP